MIKEINLREDVEEALRQYSFMQLDVFTERAFTGNPLAVFPNGEGLSDREMQQIALEMNLSETVFVLPSAHERALKRLRIFTPATELPFAGHPVVGTWNALAREGFVPVPAGGNGWTRIEQELKVGILPVDIEFKDGLPVRVVMTQGKFEIKAEVTDASERVEAARGLGLTLEDLDERWPIQTVSTGIPVFVVPIRSLEALGRCEVDAKVLGAVYRRANSGQCYAFTLETNDGLPSVVHARSFVPDFGIAEDPATGGAAGPLGAYLVHHNALDIEPVDGTYRFTIEQGDFMGRSSRLNLEVKGTQGAVEEVRVGGASVLVARGELSF